MKPCLLIASPQMKDPHFRRAVVLVWHHDDDGAIGVVINRPLPHKLTDVLDSGGDLGEVADATVSWGGPVVAQSSLPDDDGWSLGERLAVTRSQDALTRLMDSGIPFMLCLGYAGWGPGQLDQEIERGGWLWTDLDPNLVFDVPPEARYDCALANLGLTSSMVWMQPVNE